MRQPGRTKLTTGIKQHGKPGKSPKIGKRSGTNLNGPRMKNPIKMRMRGMMMFGTTKTGLIVMKIRMTRKDVGKMTVRIQEGHEYAKSSEKRSEPFEMHFYNSTVNIINNMKTSWMPSISFFKNNGTQDKKKFLKRKKL